VSELVIELKGDENAEKVEEAVRSKPSARRLVIRIAANDGVSSIERVRSLLVSNISRTVIVYVEGERDEA
jgi:tRNA threonylcarbamoyladenosine modification (KEOPS) complex  Pcc1 subunit